MTRVAGLDLSLSATGFAIYDTAWRRPYVDTIRTDPDPNRTSLAWRRHRLHGIAAGLLEDLINQDHPLDLALIEGPSYQSEGGDKHDRSGLWWLVVDGLHGAGIRVAEVPPPTLKVYVTDDGRATKQDMVRAIRNSFPGVHVEDDNAADALGLCALAARHLGHPIEAHPLTPKQLARLDIVEWPEQRASQHR